MRMRGTTIDYESLVGPELTLPYEGSVQQLLQALPPLWQKTYRKMAQSPTCIHHFTQQGFDFLFDRASELHARGVVPGERVVEDRIIVAYGRSTPATGRSDNGSRKHLLGDAAAAFGDNAERPYLPGCVLGGTFDVSLYPQYRDLDNEHSLDGRIYRTMKKYCSEHPGTFCFTRLIYSSRSWRPAVIEHGMLKQDGVFWVRKFRNTTVESRLPVLLRNGRASRRMSPESTSAD